MSFSTMSITAGKGFHFTANGYNLSVQMGDSNYCKNREGTGFGMQQYEQASITFSTPHSPDAEIAIWTEGGKLLAFDGGDTTCGWVPIAAIVDVMRAMLSPHDSSDSLMREINGIINAYTCGEGV